MNKKYYYIAAAIILLIISTLVIRKCNEPTNPKIDGTYVPIEQPIKIIYVNDSLKAISQDLLITENKQVISRLQGELREKINELAKLKPELILSYKETYENLNQVGKLKDSLSTIIARIQERAEGKSGTDIELDKYVGELLASKIPYKIENKYRYETGSIDYYGNIYGDTLQVVTEPLISFGQQKGFLKSPTYKVTIANSNPYITNSNATSVFFKPKPPIEVTIGPLVLANKDQVAGGLGITIKKGIFSASVGYMLTNTKK